MLTADMLALLLVYLHANTTSKILYQLSMLAIMLALLAHDLLAICKHKLLVIVSKNTTRRDLTISTLSDYTNN